MSKLTFKLEQIVDAMPALAIFANAEPKIPEEEKDAKDISPARRATAKETYRVGKLVKKMNAEHQDYLEARNKAVKKHGEKRMVKDPKGGEGRETWSVKPENDDAFEAEINELLEKDVELDGVEKFPWSYVERVTPVPAVMADLMDFMEEPK